MLAMFICTFFPLNNLPILMVLELAHRICKNSTIKNLLKITTHFSLLQQMSWHDKEKNTPT